MPELPEIETIKLQLDKVLNKQLITQCLILNKKTFQGNPKLIENKKIIGVRRRAKMLIVDLDPLLHKATEGQAISLVFHLKMTGQLVWEPNEKFQILNSNNPFGFAQGEQINSNIQNINVQNRIVGGPARNASIRVAGGHPTGDFVGELPSKHTRVIFHLRGGTLYFNDQRRFGWIKIITYNSQLNTYDLFKNLGPEPLEITGEKFVKLIRLKKKPIKTILMDQEIISGVGNIYANDALWESRIDPRTPVDQLSVEQLNSLFKSVKKVLREGIKYGGATAANYVDLYGMGGHYQDHFRVYKRDGLPCLKCKTIIKKIKLGGRGTYFCPKCQK